MCLLAAPLVLGVFSPAQAQFLRLPHNPPHGARILPAPAPSWEDFSRPNPWLRNDRMMPSTALSGEGFSRPNPWLRDDRSQVRWHRGYKHQDVDLNYNRGSFDGRVRTDLYTGGAYYRPGQQAGYYSDQRLSNAEYGNVYRGGIDYGTRIGPWPYGGGVDVGITGSGVTGTISAPVGIGQRSGGLRW
jgi:hypothetical protein